MTAQHPIIRPSEKSLLEIRRALQQLELWIETSGWAWNVVGPFSDDYSANINEIVQCDPPSGGFTVTLPLIQADYEGLGIVVKNVTQFSRPIMVRTSGDNLFGDAGGNEVTVLGMYMSDTFIADGDNIWVRTWHYHVGV